MSAASGSSGSGVYGKVSRGPILPVCVHAVPCVAPASVTLAFIRDGKRVAEARSSRTGDYRISLASGVYSVQPGYRHGLWRLSPRTVRIPAGRYARVNFLLDTGIR